MWGYFLDNSGLNEIGDNKNQLIDEIRSPNSVNNATVFANKIIDFATQGKDQQKIKDWVDDVVDAYNYYISQYQSVENLEQNAQAKKWGSSFEKRFVDHTISTVSDAGVGARVALELLKKAVELEPSDGYIRDSLGWAYFLSKEFEESVFHLEKAVVMLPNCLLYTSDAADE